MLLEQLWNMGGSVGWQYPFKQILLWFDLVYVVIMTLFFTLAFVVLYSKQQNKLSCIKEWGISFQVGEGCCSHYSAGQYLEAPALILVLCQTSSVKLGKSSPDTLKVPNTY